LVCVAKSAPVEHAAKTKRELSKMVNGLGNMGSFIEGTDTNKTSASAGLVPEKRKKA